MERIENELSELKRKVALAYQILYMEGAATDDTLGHLSARLPGQSVSCVKPWGVGFDEVDPTNLLEMSVEGTKIGGGPGRLHSEMPIHNEIYKARTDINCVIHIHPFFATLLTGVWKQRLLILSEDALPFAQAPGYYDSSALIRSSELGAAVAAELGSKHTLLLRNHGVITVAPTVEQAVVLAVQLERAAHDHLTMSQRPRMQDIATNDESMTSADDASGVGYCTDKFEYWCRKLKRVGRGTYCGRS